MTYTDAVREQIKDLTLILLYLNSFNNNGCCRSWKGYDFNDLNKLAEDDYISEKHNVKSVVFNNKGIERAKALCAKYGINLPKDRKDNKLKI
jgi:hypothetical protein